MKNVWVQIDNEIDWLRLFMKRWGIINFHDSPPEMTILRILASTVGFWGRHEPHVNIIQLFSFSFFRWMYWYQHCVDTYYVIPFMQCLLFHQPAQRLMHLSMEVLMDPHWKYLADLCLNHSTHSDRPRCESLCPGTMSSDTVWCAPRMIWYSESQPWWPMQVHGSTRGLTSRWMFSYHVQLAYQIGRNRICRSALKTILVRPSVFFWLKHGISNRWKLEVGSWVLSTRIDLRGTWQVFNSCQALSCMLVAAGSQSFCLDAFESWSCKKDDFIIFISIKQLLKLSVSLILWS